MSETKIFPIQNRSGKMIIQGAIRRALFTKHLENIIG